MRFRAKSFPLNKFFEVVRRQGFWLFCLIVGLESQLMVLAQIDSASFLLDTRSTTLNRSFVGVNTSEALVLVVVDSTSFPLDSRSAAQRGGMPGSDLAGSPGLLIANSAKFLIDTRSFATLWIDTQPRSQGVGFGESVTLSVAAVGAGQIRYQWLFKGQPIPGATTPELLLVSFQPAQVGDYQVVLEDQFGTLTSQVARLEGLSNRPPVVEIVGSTTVDEMAPMLLSVNVTDPDVPAQTITVSLLEGPVGMQIQPGGGLGWTPAEGQGPSTNLVSLLVSDGISRITNRISIIVREINRPPAFIGTIANTEVAPGDVLSVAVAAQDPDEPSNRLTWRLVSGPPGSSINPTNGLWNWKPSALTPPGNQPVLVAVDDDGTPPLSATNRFSAVVRDASVIVTNQLVLRVGGHGVASGGEVSVPVTVQNFQLVDTLQFTLEWDPSVISLKNTKNFGLPGLTEANFGAAKDSQGRTNRLTFSWDDSTFVGVTRTNGASLFEVVFLGVGGQGSATSIRFSGSPTPSVASVNAEEVPLTTLGGSVTLVSRISGLVDYYSGSGGPLVGVLIATGIEGGGTASTGVEGTYSMEMPAGSFTLTPTLETDNPPASGVTTADITLVRRHILGITPLDSAHKVLAGDVNGSSSVTTADITLIRRLILGTSTNYPAGLWRFLPSDEVFTNSMMPWLARRSRSYGDPPSVVTGHDFKAIKLGDVNGSWKAAATPGATTVRAKSRGTGSRSTARLVVAQGSELTGGVRVYPVTLSGVHLLSSLQFTLAWDPAEALFEGVEAGVMKDLGPENLGLSRVGMGQLPVSWDPPSGLAHDLRGEAVVLSLKLRVRSGRSLSRLTVPERPTSLEVTEASMPVAVAAVGWVAGFEGLATSGVTENGGGSASASARLRVLGPDAAGRVILEAEGSEERWIQVQGSKDLRSWIPVWQGFGQGPDSPIRIEPTGLGVSEMRFWRVDGVFD